MAGAESSLIGRINNGAFETVGRTESWAEQRIANAIVVGKFADLDGQAKPGDSMAQHAGWFGGKWNGNWFIRTTDLTSTDGISAELRMSLILCANGKTRPYNVTWDVGMEEVQMKLISHPDIQANCSMERLLRWENTPAGERVKVDKDGNVEYRYATGQYNSDGSLKTEKINKPWEIAYCKAVVAGITTYNRYAPILTKTSYYLELPGVNYDSNTHQVTGGTISEFTGSSEIGKFSNPPLNISGYGSSEGLWFKNGDRFTCDAAGCWQRIETWTFTPDKKHAWIYTGQLS